MSAIRTSPPGIPPKVCPTRNCSSTGEWSGTLCPACKERIVDDLAPKQRGANGAEPKADRKFKPKPCATCGNEFSPNTSAQKFCPSCKAKPKPAKKRQAKLKPAKPTQFKAVAAEIRQLPPASGKTGLTEYRDAYLDGLLAAALDPDGDPVLVERFHAIVGLDAA